jgi:hypothetical protein
MLRPLALLVVLGCGGTVAGIPNDVAVTNSCAVIASRYASALARFSCGSMSMDTSMSAMTCVMQRTMVMGAGNDATICTSGMAAMVSEAGADALDNILTSYNNAGCGVAMCDTGMMTR